MGSIPAGNIFSGNEDGFITAFLIFIFELNRNPKGDSSFFIFYSALDILTIAIKITLTDFKNRNRMLLTKVTTRVTKI